MNWLDRAVSFVSPEAALRRLRARAALGVVRSYDKRRVRAYDAGKSTRRTDGWSSSGSSANTEVAASLATVRNRSRELVRNNPHALRAINMLTAKSVGTGIRARWDKGAQPAWNEFCDSCDFEGDLDLYGLQSLIARTGFESGECLIRRVRRTAGRVPLQLQVLEPDYLDSTKYGPSQNGNYIVAGVEIDTLGRKQAYWLWDQHPGETTYRMLGLKSVRVPASEIILFGEKLRPGQLRFMPRLAAAMMRLRDFDDYRDALIVKKKIEACFAAFVVGGTPSTPLGEATDDSETGKRTETLSPGIIEYVNGGQDVKFANPSTGSDDGFSVQELHSIAAGAGVTYEQLTGDLSGVNYSSIRSGMLDFKDLVEAWRWTFFMPMAMRRIGEWFLEAAWTAGSVRTMNYGVIWTPPKWPWVDPVKDVEAAKLEMRAGMASLSEKIRELGYDPDDVFAEIAKEREQLKKLLIVVDSNAEVASQGASSLKEPATVAADKAAADKAAEDAAAARAEEKKDTKQLLLALTAAATREHPLHVVNTPVTIAEGAVRVDAPVNVAPAAVTVERTEVKIEKGAVQVDAPVTLGDTSVAVDTKQGATRTTVEQRDAKGELLQYRTEPLDKKED